MTSRRNRNRNSRDRWANLGDDVGDEEKEELDGYVDALGPEKMLTVERHIDSLSPEKVVICSLLEYITSQFLIGFMKIMETLKSFIRGSKPMFFTPITTVMFFRQPN